MTIHPLQKIILSQTFCLLLSWSCRSEMRQLVKYLLVTTDDEIFKGMISALGTTGHKSENAGRIKSVFYLPAMWYNSL